MLTLVETVTIMGVQVIEKEVILMAIAEVLKFESNASVFAWKHPNSELATWTQLIVHESQEAILVKNGQIADVFGPGRHVLSTDNIPILQSIINLPFGKRSPFSAEVWFINRAFSLDIKWGTTTPIQLQDPKYGVFVPVRAFGQFGIQVTDSRRFLTKLVGTMPFFNSETMTTYFRGLYVTRVKDRLSSCLVKSKISILEINAQLNEISKELEEELRAELKPYGIYIASFYVNDISAPENDPAIKKLKEALAKRAEMDIIGYSYQQERTFDTLGTAAGNTGAAGTAMGAGMGMGFGMGNTMGNALAGMGNVMNTQEATKKCPNCGATIGEHTKFCPECGTDTTKKEEKAQLVCSACGGKITAGTKFCPNCGRKINACGNCGADMPDGADTCPSCGQKLCPNCGKTVAAGAKFCLECGCSLVKKCPNCGKEIKEDTKFCSECGTKL